MKKPLVSFAVVLIFGALFALCLVSAATLLAPRNMPFGVTGPSPVVAAVQSKYSLHITTYSSEGALTQAARRGDIYGGYIPGPSSDQLVTVRIVMPSDLKPDEKELYERLKTLRSESPRSGYAQG